MVRLGMLIDLKICVGCQACTVACKEENGAPSDIWWAPVYTQEMGKYPNAKRIFIPTLCNHCEDAPCMKACPSHAIFRTANGEVLIDEEKCCGAQACVAACPYGAMHFPGKENYTYFPEHVTPFEEHQMEKRKKARTSMKCTFCAHRTSKGLEPACVVTCPVDCRIFGDLDDPTSKPNRYLQERGLEMEELIQLRPEAKTKPKVLYLPP